MKSYTDITQSKKLVEILPNESADQTWEIIAIAGANLDVPEEMQYWHNGNTPCILNSKIGIPCWSLAALLQIMPHCIDVRHELVFVRYDLELGKLSDNKGWYVMYDNVNHFVNIYIAKSNLLDACVEMIIKLHEQKLI